jgi:preprotein translocase subunit SecF
MAWEGQAFVKSRWKRAMSTTMNHDVLMGFYSSIFLGGTIRNHKRNQRKRHKKKEKKPQKCPPPKNIHKPS